MKLLAFAASNRKESMNRKLAYRAAEFARTEGAAIEFVEYDAFNAPSYDDEAFDGQTFPASVAGFAARLAACNGIILASPEYNWSFPGSLKNLIDWASVVKPNPFDKKTVLLLSASPSLRGGAEGLVQLRTPLAALGAFVYPKLFTLSRADDEVLKSPKLTGDLQQMVKGYIAFANALL